MREKYHKRHIEAYLAEALRDSPIVLIQGARQCGKTTLARKVGKSAEYAYFSFDSRAVYEVAANDPAEFVSTLPERVILDEVQRVPEIIPEIKLSVDNDRTAGRFILTGSVSLLHMRQITDSLAGRMRIVNLYPFSQCELSSTVPTFVDALFEKRFKTAQKATTKTQLVTRIMKGGFPTAITYENEKSRTAWYLDYVESLMRHDVPQISKIQSYDALTKLLSQAALQTAQLCNTNNFAKSFRLGRPTIDNYLKILEMIFMTSKIQAWHNNQGKRLIKTPKLHIGDTGIACALLSLNQTALENNTALLGQLLETFVFQELQRQMSGERLSRFSYYRDKDGTEVDIVIERGAMALVGVEVKLSTTVTQSDFSGLRKLQRTMGKRFKGGAVFYTGNTILPFGKDLFALPIECLWENNQ